MDSTNETPATPIEAHKPDPRQQAFDFQRAAKLRIIERAQLLMLPLKAQLRAKSLLTRIESHSRDHASCWLSIDTLRIEMGASERTIQRAIKDCEAAGLLRVVRHKRAASTFSLEWSLLIDLSRETLDEVTWSQIRDGFDAVSNSRQGCQINHPRVTDQLIKGDRSARQVSPLSAPRIPSKKPSTTEATKQNQTTTFKFDFQAVVVALEDQGILAGGQSVLAASANGASAEFLLELIAHAQRVAINGVRAYGPGALMRRIGRARPSQSVDALWPPPCAGYLREVEREKNRRPALPQPSSAEPPERPARECSDEERLALSAKLAECIQKLRKPKGVIA